MSIQTRPTGTHAHARPHANRHEPSTETPLQRFARRAAAGIIVAGMTLYALAAPHSIAASWVGLSVAAFGWLLRVLVTGSSGLRRTVFDLPVCLFVLWTLASIFLSAEPRMSLSKIPSVTTFLVFYLAQAALTRRMAVGLAALLVLSGAAGALRSVVEVARGRGVIIEEIEPGSPLAGDATQLKEGDAVWRIGQRTVASVAEIDDAIRNTRAGERLTIHVVSQGEHVVREGGVVTNEMKNAASPSGLRGERRTHRFRASGWTRHYETFAELLQISAQLALGFALANLRRQRERMRVVLPALAFILLATGIALTAMRTVLVAFAVGVCVVAWRSTTRGRAQFAVSFVVVLALTLGAFAVWQTRATGALRLRDDSAALRIAVARRGLERIPVHPVFGHGMDSVKLHWQEWGFPGGETIHTHSTWIQLAFDRGLPALLFWLWIVGAFWLLLLRAERMWRDTEEAGTHGFVLGATGALAGFFASSLVNYNFGDAEVAILIWWLMGAIVVSVRDSTEERGLLKN